ncbi:MAG: hypothetical protein Q9195_007373 [Heterodermia aff. obscurata]
MAAKTALPDGATISLPSGFEIHGVTSKLLAKTPSTTPAPPLRVLDNFKGAFVGNGFNTIFRPQSSVTPTTFPVSPPRGTPDNVLELNLTAETLSFADALGSVPNRGLLEQGDIFLSGVPYVQTINDVTNPATGKADGVATGIHFEPGLWMRVPASTTNPVLVETLNRMASIPHGTTINAQGVAPTSTTPGKPNIPDVNITPFFIGTNPPQFNRFPNQDVNSKDTLRLPQDLTKFISAGTITQDILNNPNLVLKNANNGKTINKTTTIKIQTNPAAPQLGGGTANIDFLVGGNTGGTKKPNAEAVQMNATFWISEVSHKLTIPVHALGQGPLEIKAPSPVAGAPDGFQAPSFIVDPPAAITAPKTITVTSTQIQYSQTVILNFAPLSWPHVSVATLIPKDPIKVPSSVFS